jgi:hypothetical protein
MRRYSSRFLKRFALLVPGIIIAYFSVRDIFPYFDKRLPLGLAIFVTYVLAAYLLIPALIRVIRVVRPATHLPLYCVTPDGFASDPLNVGLIGTRLELIEAMETAGWYIADPPTMRNTARQIISTLFSRSYPTAPMSRLYLFGRKQDIAFEIPIEGSGSGSRHHVRFWATTYTDGKRLTTRHINWHHRRTHLHDTDTTLLWVGAASLDVGIAPIRHNMQITHMIDPNTDHERDLIVDQLRRQHTVEKVTTIKLGEPYQLVNRAFRGYLKTDGKMAVVQLKSGT